MGRDCDVTWKPAARFRHVRAAACDDGGRDVPADPDRTDHPEEPAAHHRQHGAGAAGACVCAEVCVRCMQRLRVCADGYVRVHRRLRVVCAKWCVHEVVCVQRCTCREVYVVRSVAVCRRVRLGVRKRVFSATPTLNKCV